MTINNNLLELDAFKSFMNEYDFPKELKINVEVVKNINNVVENNS